MTAPFRIKRSIAKGLILTLLTITLQSLVLGLSIVLKAYNLYPGNDINNTAPHSNNASSLKAEGISPSKEGNVGNADYAEHLNKEAYSSTKTFQEDDSFEDQAAKSSATVK